MLQYFLLKAAHYTTFATYVTKARIFDKTKANQM